jgi:hydroxymethylglutaryl-CoA lyase
MADSDAVFAALTRRPGVAYTALTPNTRGLERAREAAVDEVAVFAAASESFSQRNIRCSIAESLTRFEPVLAQAQEAGLPVRGYVSCVLGCPYEGEIAPQAVLDVSRALLDMGCYEVSLGDTIGVGTAGSMQALLDVLLPDIPAARLAAHCHDTYGQALANIFVALQNGVRRIDAAVAGLGGCPYAPGATGNVATEDVVYMLHGMGLETGIDLDRLVAAGEEISTALGRETGSRVAAAFARRRAD